LGGVSQLQVTSPLEPLDKVATTLTELDSQDITTVEPSTILSSSMKTTDDHATEELFTTIDYPEKAIYDEEEASKSPLSLLTQEDQDVSEEQPVDRQPLSSQEPPEEEIEEEEEEDIMPVSMEEEHPITMNVSDDIEELFGEDDTTTATLEDYDTIETRAEGGSEQPPLLFTETSLPSSSLSNRTTEQEDISEALSITTPSVYDDQRHSLPPSAPSLSTVSHRGRLGRSRMTTTTIRNRPSSTRESDVAATTSTTSLPTTTTTSGHPKGLPGGGGGGGRRGYARSSPRGNIRGGLSATIHRQLSSATTPALHRPPAPRGTTHAGRGTRGLPRGSQRP
jgi:hypothetical protein